MQKFFEEFLTHIKKVRLNAFWDLHLLFIWELPSSLQQGQTAMKGQVLKTRVLKNKNMSISKRRAKTEQKLLKTIFVIWTTKLTVPSESELIKNLTIPTDETEQMEVKRYQWSIEKPNIHLTEFQREREKRRVDKKNFPTSKRKFPWDTRKV